MDLFQEKKFKQINDSHLNDLNYVPNVNIVMLDVFENDAEKAVWFNFNLLLYNYNYN